MKNRLTKFLLLVLSLAMVLTCTLSGAAVAEEELAELVVVGINNDPGDIGPFQGMSSGRIGIIFTTYEFLITQVDGERVYCLANDVSQVDDLVYDVTLYDYIYDQAGNHLTASDVVFCYETAIATGNLPKLGSIESVEVVSDYVVRFTFSSLSTGDLDALLMECPIVTQAAYEASEDNMATDPVTTSAYQLVEFVSGSTLVYEYTGNYWQTDESLIAETSKHNVQTIEFDIITDSAQLTNALKTGAIDVSVWISSTDIVDFEDVEGYTVSQVPENLTELLIFNCSEDSVFYDNLELRQAVAYAIDSTVIAEGAFNGDAVAVKTVGNSKYADYVSSWDDEEYYEYDLDKAKELYEASGASNVTLKLMYVTGDENTMMATIIQAELAELGITVELCGYDSTLYNEYKYESTEWDLLLDEEGSSTNLANVFKLSWDNTGYTHGGAVNFIVDDTLQALIEAACDEDTHSDETMDAFHQYVKENCYGIGLVQTITNIAHSDTIKTLATCFRIQVLPGACEY